MSINDLKKMPLWQMTGEEFLSLQTQLGKKPVETQEQPKEDLNTKFVYGLQGLANLFGCSIPTANRIKQSGKIDKAITQIGRKIIIDSEMALELAGRKNGGRS